MTRFGRSSLLLSLATLVVFALAVPAVATGEESEAGTETETETVVTTDIEPAVPVTTPPPEAGVADWTYRYLVPTGIALAILVILATTGQYFTNVVRKRYRIVEE